MDLAVIITTLIAVVTLILQIVILSNQKKNAKLISDFIRNRQKPQHSDRERFHDRRDGNYNKNRRSGGPQNNSRNSQAQQSSPPAAVDSVEKSLRDINLKLKNAERDQEVARKKLTDPMGKEGGQRSRSNRDRNRGNKDSHRRDRGNRNNFRNRNDEDRGSEKNDRSKDHPAAEDKGNPVEIAPVSPVSAVSAVSTPAILPDLQPKDFDNDLEHGRKFSVKRRVLQEEGAPTGVGQVEESRPAESEYSAPVQDAPVDNASAEDAEISFGRR